MLSAEVLALKLGAEHNLRVLTGQSRAEQSRAEQSRAEQSRAEQSRAEQQSTAHKVELSVVYSLQCKTACQQHKGGRGSKAGSHLWFEGAAHAYVGQ